MAADMKKVAHRYTQTNCSCIDFDLFDKEPDSFNLFYKWSGSQRMREYVEYETSSPSDQEFPRSYMENGPAFGRHSEYQRQGIEDYTSRLQYSIMIDLTPQMLFAICIWWRRKSDIYVSKLAANPDSTFQNPMHMVESFMELWTSVEQNICSCYWPWHCLMLHSMASCQFVVRLFDLSDSIAKMTFWEQVRPWPIYISWNIDNHKVGKECGLQT